MLLQLIDLIIGLAVVFLIFSAVTSQCAEMLEATIRRRGDLLLKGIDEVLRGLRVEGYGPELLKTFYNSPHIASLYSGEAQVVQTNATDGPAAQGVRFLGGKPPSYIPAERFAAAVLWLQQHEQSMKPLMDRLVAVALTLRSGNPNRAQPMEVANAQQALVDFYRESTDRFSGWYRAHVRLVLFALGLLVAALFNVDTIQLVRTLSQDSQLAARIADNVAASTERLAPLGALPGPAAPSSDGSAAANRSQIEAQLDLAKFLGLPIGWGAAAVPDEWWSPWLALKALGLLLTALALCAGAPFWFDLLNNLVALRSAVKPDEEESSATEGTATPPNGQPTPSSQ
ncbi:hypothetical protein [uncultured Pseudacidovorax sp.]|uniref:hypothetical protein n=1 Tax=uncultured Pseudacidovorax sp. TaxID=679313 RepID=UPI0025CE3E9A|nr:hypothetical protein [uncultured Pseudacidovorax sp.]